MRASQHVQQTISYLHHIAIFGITSRTYAEPAKNVRQALGEWQIAMQNLDRKIGHAEHRRFVLAQAKHTKAGAALRTLRQLEHDKTVLMMWRSTYLDAQIKQHEPDYKP